MRIARKITALLLVAAIAAFAGGCWDYSDPEDLLYVTGMSFDRMPDGRIHDTIEFSTVKGESMIAVPAYLEIDGDTFYDAMSNAIKVAEKQMNWSHMQVVIVSQEIARNDMGALLDLLVRLPGVRFSVVVLVSKQATACEVMKAANPSGSLNTFDIMGSLRAENQLEKAPYIKLYEFADAVADERQSAVLPAVGLANTGEGKIVEVSGTAVFRGPWLQGFLDELDTEAVMLLDFRKNVYDMPLPVDPGGKYHNASVEFSMERLEIVPSFENDKARVDIYIRGSIIPTEISGASTDPEKFCTVTNALTTGTATRLENSVKTMILHTKQLGGCDVLNIGNRLRNRQPDEWKKINGKWRDYYNNLEVNVKAGVTLRNTGDELQPITKGE